MVDIRSSCRAALMMLPVAVGLAAAQPPRVEIKALVSNPSEALPLLFLQKQQPGRFAVDMKFLVDWDVKTGQFTRPAGEAELHGYLRAVYALKRYPDTFYDYVRCAESDPSGAGCVALLRMDFSQFNPRDPALLEELKGHAAQARALEVSGPTPAVFINGKPYYRELLLAQLLPYLNWLLPPGDRLPGYRALDFPPAIKLYAVAAPSGIGSRDKTWENGLLRSVPDFEVVPVAPESAQGKRLLEQAGAVALPAYIPDEEFVKRPGVLKRLEQRGVVDNGGGHYRLTDVPAPRLLQRPAQPHVLTVFVMSQCPFGVKAENAVLETLKLKKLPQDFKLNVRFIVSPDKAGKGAAAWQSLHGPAELDEDVRQIAIQKYFPDKFPGYLEIRNSDYQSPKWEEAAQKAGLDPEAVKGRLKEGLALLEKDWKETEALGVSGSPTFLWEDRYLLAPDAELKAYLGVDPYESTKAAGGSPAAGAACNAK